MPPVPLETKYHPSAVDILLIKRLIAETSKQTLLQFLQHEFVSIGKSHAERLIGELGPDFSPKMLVKSLTSQQIVRIHQLFRQAKFDDPSGDVSPALQISVLLVLGISMLSIEVYMIAIYFLSPIRSAQVFEGHPFIVEAGVSLGGKDVKQGLNIFRFANRIPLLFEQGADVVTRTAMKRINYKINQAQDKIGIFVSIVSTKIPFKGTGKEYIGDDISEIASAVKTAIRQCCSQLKSKIVKRIQAREQQERKRNLSRYIPNASNAIFDVLKDMANQHASKKKRFEGEDADLLKQVSVNSVTREILKDKLAQHVEKVDYEMALEYATQTGVKEEPREDIYLQALSDDKSDSAPRLPPQSMVTPGITTALLPTNPPFLTLILPYFTSPPPSYMWPKSKASLPTLPYSSILTMSGFKVAPMLSIYTPSEATSEPINLIQIPIRKVPVAVSMKYSPVTVLMACHMVSMKIPLLQIGSVFPLYFFPTSTHLLRAHTSPAKIPDPPHHRGSSHCFCICVVSVALGISLFSSFAAKGQPESLRVEAAKFAARLPRTFLYLASISSILSSKGSVWFLTITRFSEPTKVPQHSRTEFSGATESAPRITSFSMKEPGRIKP
nr:DNA topoisomerase 6 subunit B isoform X1 [Ipomoea batatas]